MTGLGNETRIEKVIPDHSGIRGCIMGNYLVVSRVENLEKHMALSREYGVSFEINDFYDPDVLEDRQRQQHIIAKYREIGIPEGSTMHGAFLDVVVFSQDPGIRKVSERRMRQSMELAAELGVKGVVFHTNVNPMLSARYLLLYTIIQKNQLFVSSSADIRCTRTDLPGNPLTADSYVTGVLHNSTSTR